MNNWNGVDFFIFLIFAANTLLGMSRGATKEIISSICLSVGLIFMIKFTVPLATFFNQSPIMVDVVNSYPIQAFMSAIGAGPLTSDLLIQIFYSLSILVCFVGPFSVCEAALTKAGMVEMYPFPYATLNRKIGAGLGATRGYVITLIFLVIFTLHIFRNAGDTMFSNSFFVNLFKSNIVKLDSIITGQKPESYKDIFEGKDLYKAANVLENMSGTVNGQPASQALPAQQQQPAAPAPQQLPSQ